MGTIKEIPIPRCFNFQSGSETTLPVTIDSEEWFYEGIEGSYGNNTDMIMAIWK